MDDLISRQAAIDAVINADYKDCGVLVERRCRKFEEALRSLPTAEVEPVKHGKWIVEHGVLYGHGKDVNYGDLWHCSECGRRELDVEGWGYCPTCGAKMIS